VVPPLLIAAIALAGRYSFLWVLPSIGCQRPANINLLIELALFVSPHETLVAASIDQFAFAVSLMWHYFLLKPAQTCNVREHFKLKCPRTIHDWSSKLLC
jgi:hypothetical protein